MSRETDKAVESARDYIDQISKPLVGKDYRDFLSSLVSSLQIDLEAAISESPDE